MITSAIFCGFHLFFSSFLVCLFPVILGAFTLSWALLPFFVRGFHLFVFLVSSMLRPPAGVLSTRSRVRLSSWNAS